MKTTFAKGKPKAQPRPRLSKWGAYNPPTAKAWKKAVAESVADHIGMFQKGEPVMLLLTFYFKRPKSHTKTNGELRKGINSQHVQKPDIDNIVKSTVDAMTDVGVWHDDCQIVHCVTTKYWAADWENEGCEIKFGHY